ncbi:DUF4232 domain-containing protein [Saccharopolyspora sp. K220]|uniref:DUF4232 domain-containing protein n=1 Tax=Saccharopolyspora soli TaxID=2926618 RepID=UPI001F560A70|nr:DUF4232 domain-containing protein [Saccharopolyspora soli]MCI2420189.1 DUF4232 domain-containing protein [Saccharopolyspora soli]
MIRAKFFAITAAALAVGTVGLSACSPGGSSAQAPTDQAPVSQATGSSGATSGLMAQSPTDQESGTDAGLCTAGDLQLSFGRGGGAAGTTYRPLIFTNTSDQACVLQGFPGVSYVGGEDGHQVGAAAYRDGSKGPAVTLAPGDQASAVIGFATVENYEAEVCRPEPVKGLRIYPPQETASMYIPFDYAETGCANEQLPGNQLTVQTIQAGTGEQ